MGHLLQLLPCAALGLGQPPQLLFRAGLGLGQGAQLLGQLLHPLLCTALGLYQLAHYLRECNPSVRTQRRSSASHSGCCYRIWMRSRNSWTVKAITSPSPIIAAADSLGTHTYCRPTLTIQAAFRLYGADQLVGASPSWFNYSRHPFQRSSGKQNPPVYPETGNSTFADHLIGVHPGDGQGDRAAESGLPGFLGSARPPAGQRPLE